MVTFPPLPALGKGRLWITDGTESGTKELKSDMRILTWYPVTYINKGTKAIFAGQTEAHGTELWVTDGTASGTKILKNIAPGNRSSVGSGSDGRTTATARIGDKLYFTAYERGSLTGKPAVNERRLYETDGTPAGTKELLRYGGKTPRLPYIAKGNTSVSAGFIYKFNTLLTDGKRLYLTLKDGMPIGGYQKSVVAFNPETKAYQVILHDQNLRSVSRIGKHTFAHVSSLGSPTFSSWYRFEEKKATKLAYHNIRNLGPISLIQKTSSVSHLPHTVNDDGSFSELKLTGLNAAPDFSQIRKFFFKGGVFYGFDKNKLLRLETSGAASLLDTGGAAKIHDSSLLVDKLILAATNEEIVYPNPTAGNPNPAPTPSANCKGSEPWVLDAKGLKMLKDINPSSCSVAGTLRSNSIDDFLGFSTMGPVGNNKKVLFLGYDPASPEPTGYELWTTDGTEAGTKILKDIAPNSENGVSMY